MDGTLPISRQPRLPVQTVSVEVVSGPDRGTRGEAQHEMMTLGTAPSNDLVLSDPTVSGFHLELSRSPAGVGVNDLGSTNGTWVGAYRIERGVVPPGTTLRLGTTEVRIHDGSGTVVEVYEEDHLDDLFGITPAMRRLMAQVERIARANVPVLILGESGTGKELVARAIHRHGHCPEGPFVTVDCGALAPALVASELFGHERGAFTGAERQHIGALERAHGGTLFLDEIGELPSELQPQLLGALERRRFRRVGGRTEIAVDLRLVSATNRDLRSEVNRGAFRMDLYFRIAVVAMQIPPLRERIEDIPLLVQQFLHQAGHTAPMSEILSKQAMEHLLQHRWPGNVRELRNWVEATLALGEAPELFSELPESAQPNFECAPQLLSLSYKDARNRILERFEDCYLRGLMERAHDNVAQASRIARMDRSYLIKLLQKHGFRQGRDSLLPAADSE